VSPDAVQSHHDSHDVDLHNLDLSNYDYFLDDDSANGVDRGIQGVHRFLQTAKDEIHKSNNQRFVMLIVRGNDDDSKNDSIYIMKPKYNNSIPVSSEHCETPYLVNSQKNIIRGLSSSADGVLGFSHHWHSKDRNTVFLSIDRFTEMVTKSTMVQKLQLVSENKINSNLSGSYQDLPNTYSEYGDYWFGHFGKKYQCFEPYFNEQDPRSKKNIYISKQCTNDLTKYVDEFKDISTLYYNFDYTVAMQIIDGQTVRIHFDDGTNVCLVKTGFHKNGKSLYAVIVPNTKPGTQRWKIIDYQRIEQAFMTADQLQSKKGIYSFDLPKGSKTIHNNWQKDQDQIDINEALIHKTLYVPHKPNVRIIQSEKKGNKKGKTIIKMHPHTLYEHIIESLKKNKLTSTVYFNFDEKKYHLEKLLPVKLPEHGAYVGVCFRYNTETKSTRISGIALDLTDIKHKASLVNAVHANSWLNQVSNSKIINRFTLLSGNSPRNRHQYMPATNTQKERLRLYGELDLLDIEIYNLTTQITSLISSNEYHLKNELAQQITQIEKKKKEMLHQLYLLNTHHFMLQSICSQKQTENPTYSPSNVIPSPHQTPEPNHQPSPMTSPAPIAPKIVKKGSNALKSKKKALNVCAAPFVPSSIGKKKYHKKSKIELNDIME